MASDYSSIRAENEGRYGTDIGRIGPMLFADRYAERTHFIYELLQNAEDALIRRGQKWDGRREVRFELDGSALRVSHCGAPFDRRDVRGICGIAESQKEQTAIGRFGIGFKSVYAFTDLPEVHSGGEDFVIENFVWPAAARAIEGQDDETVFVLPLRAHDRTAVEEIAKGLERLGPQVLLFLRAIEEISWSVQDGPSGHYLRSRPACVTDNARKTELVWQGGQDNAPADETWLVFSRPVRPEAGETAGYVEIGFRLDGQDNKEVVRRVDESPLVVFFPTVLETHLGFLVQGPYRTTPTRDNVPQDDPWNRHLIRETGDLLVEALCTLRDMNLLDADALCVLPLERSRFSEGSMFAPLFEAVLQALRTKRVLPCFSGGHVMACQAKLARSQELRELFGPSQLAALFGLEGELAWLSGDITQDRTPELRQYLIQDLEVSEVTPDMILARLDSTFLEAQSDEWIISLYEFLNGRPALHRGLGEVPIVRLADGSHVTGEKDGRLQAFLPSQIETGFPTVRRVVCATEEARKFLQSLGLTEPDPVDDVVWNVLPRYQAEDARITDAHYGTDIHRILTAFGTDSKTQREKLLTALRDSFFVKAVDGGSGAKKWAKPGAAYLATERLKELFAGVTGVLLVDDSYACLKGEHVRDLLERCGATRYLQLVAVESNFTFKQRCEMRVAAGCENCTWDKPIEDHGLRGLDLLLSVLPRLHVEDRRKKPALLWEALGDLEDRRSTASFSGTYWWTYYHLRSATFDAAFVRQLNETAWVPDENGDLQPAEFIVFDTLGWKPNPFLLSKIRFKPPIIDTLAKEAGIEPGVLDLLKKYGLTSEAELKARLGIKDGVSESEKKAPGVLRSENESEEAPSDTEGRRTSSRTSAGESGGSRESVSTATAGVQEDAADKTIRDGRGGTPTATGERQFISYVAVRRDEEEPDPDGLDQQARMALEEKAIQFILQREPQLHRTPTHNPGYDLFETGDDEQIIRWVEVKAMTRSLTDRPVGLSRTQFECAREHGEAYWLYVVEHTGSLEHARIVRVQDPAGKARTFTFDRGWLSVADINDKNNDLG